MSRITKGQSTNDSIMYSTSKASIQVNFNGVVLFKEMNEVCNKENQEGLVARKALEQVNKKLGLRYGINAFYIFIFLVEVINCFYFFKAGDKTLGLSIAAIVMMYAIYDAIVDGGKIARDMTFCQNHAAEHKVYNAYKDGLEVNAKNAKASDMYSRRCGSVKIANMFFLELINIILILMIGVWIPNVVILLFVFNYDRALLNNIFCIAYQKFLTKEPNDDSLFIALLAMKLVLRADEIRAGGMEFSPDVLKELICKMTNEILNEGVLNISLDKYEQLRY